MMLVKVTNASLASVELSSGKRSAKTTATIGNTTLRFLA